MFQYPLATILGLRYFGRKLKGVEICEGFSRKNKEKKLFTNLNGNFSKKNKNSFIQSTHISHHIDRFIIQNEYFALSRIIIFNSLSSIYWRGMLAWTFLVFSFVIISNYSLNLKTIFMEFYVIKSLSLLTLTFILN